MGKTTKDDSTIPKRAAIALLSRGLATKAEMARCAGVSKQLMQHWAADIDTEKARDAVVSRLWLNQLKKYRKS